jgi:7,8-dihydroneopterin aldolase/epimerase/oxygenase
VANDRIFLEGIVFYGMHGVDPAEQELGQRFVVDVEVVTDLRKPGRSDAVADTVNYADVYRFAKAVVEGPSRNLIETVAEEIARRIAEYWPEIEEIRVRVRKPAVPIKGSVLAAAGVEVIRRPRIDFP